MCPMLDITAVAHVSMCTLAEWYFVTCSQRDATAYTTAVYKSLFFSGVNRALRDPGESIT
jgi:hypothetical protein